MDDVLTLRTVPWPDEAAYTPERNLRVYNDSRAERLWKGLTPLEACILECAIVAGFVWVADTPGDPSKLCDLVNTASEVDRDAALDRP